MKTPDIPPDEDSRLGALRAVGILDTLPEERFDRVTRMAKRMFGVPIALVSLVDENRQWFKSCLGLGAKETSRDISFCGHAILGDDVFHVPDASADERFADNPLVADDPHIRFYAGCPLKVDGGSRLGTLCIIDREPRELTDDDLQALRDLAALVERELAAVQLATLDELTGLTNRRGFMMLARHSLSLCIRRELPASLLFLDLNAFKPINDTFGHGEGDRALQAFAMAMKSTFRESDLIARLGGDEFVALFTDTPAALAEEAVARFQRALTSYNRAANRGYELSFSHGVVEFDLEQHPSIDCLLEDGDALMYERKNQCQAEGGRRTG